MGSVRLDTKYLITSASNYIIYNTYYANNQHIATGVPTS